MLCEGRLNDGTGKLNAGLKEVRTGKRLFDRFAVSDRHTRQVCELFEELQSG